MNLLISVPITLLLVIRSYRRQSLTPLGIVFAGLTAGIHSLHPSALPFTLLCTFFLAGTTATKVHHAKKASLTLSAASGATGGEGPRTHIQVLANSACASFLVLLHVWRYGYNNADSNTGPSQTKSECLGLGSDVLLAGIVANYAAVAADTLSSELGILARTKPRLITTLKTVPPGTNGGVTLEGLAAGCLGGFIIAVTSAVLGTFCPGPARDQSVLKNWLGRSNTDAGWTLQEKLGWVAVVTVWGLLGSVLDSVLGALLQASVVDRRTGKVVEGSGGEKVLTSSSSITSHLRDSAGLMQRKTKTNDNNGKVTRAGNAEDHDKESRVILSGRDILDNNQINLLMASIMTVGGVLGASVLWDVPLIS